jgi:hypothetical protein
MKQYNKHETTSQDSYQQSNKLSHSVQDGNPERSAGSTTPWPTKQTRDSKVKGKSRSKTNKEGTEEKKQSRCKDNRAGEDGKLIGKENAQETAQRS